MNRPLQAILLPCMIAAMIGATMLAPVMAMTVGSSQHICKTDADACPMAVPAAQTQSCCAKHDDGASAAACDMPAVPVNSNQPHESNCPDHCPCCVVGPMSVAWAPAAIDAIHFSQTLTHDDVVAAITANASDWVHDLFHPPCL